VTDPRSRPDGCCVVCLAPKNRTRKQATGRSKATPGFTRQNRKLWLIHLDRDPFCCRICCEAYYGLLETNIRRRCPQCGKTFVVPKSVVVSKRFCSNACGHVSRRRRRVSIPDRCAGCGGVYDEFTRNCHHCDDRARSRRKREKEAA
jgi:endogenous inhibitor of DNA gyrase (YacG/DUF329 family)